MLLPGVCDAHWAEHHCSSASIYNQYQSYSQYPAYFKAPQTIVDSQIMHKLPHDYLMTALQQLLRNHLPPAIKMAHTLSRQVTWYVIALLRTTLRPQLAWRHRARTRPLRMWKKPAAKALGGRPSHNTRAVSGELRAPAAKIGGELHHNSHLLPGRQCCRALITLIPSGNCWQGGRRRHGERLQWADGLRWCLRCRCLAPTQIITIS